MCVFFPSHSIRFPPPFPPLTFEWILRIWYIYVNDKTSPLDWLKIMYDFCLYVLLHDRSHFEPIQWTSLIINMNIPKS